MKIKVATHQVPHVHPEIKYGGLSLIFPVKTNALLHFGQTLTSGGRSTAAGGTKVDSAALFLLMRSGLATY